MYLPIQLSRNKVLARMDAYGPGTVVNRSTLRYDVDVQLQPWYRAGTFVPASNGPLQGSETPPERRGGALVYPGALFELQDLLDGHLTRTAPRFGQTQISVCEGMTRQFYVDTTVRQDGLPVSAGRLPTQWVLKAGIAERDWSAWQERVFTLPEGLAGRFLTNQPDGKQILPNQPEYLYWLNNCSTSPTRIKVMATVLYSDSTKADCCCSTFDSLATMSVYCVPTGPVALGLAKADRQIVRYAVWLTDEQDQPVSETRLYFVDNRYMPDYRYIVFANSLGGFDTVALVGDSSEKVGYTRLISERPTDPLGLPTYAERVVSQVTGERELTANTALIAPDQRTWLQDLLLSEEIYVVTDRSHLPLLIQNQDYPASDTTELLGGRSLTFRYANRERNATGRLAVAPALPSRPTIWNVFAFSCELDSRGKRTGRKLATLLQLTYQDTGEVVKPTQIRANLPNEEGYLSPISSPDCQQTPFVSAAISRYGTYKRATCGVGYTGVEALIGIAAGAYGSEISQADADAKAEAAWSQLNTQATADATGVCDANPANYAANVPNGQFHVRLTHPRIVLIYTNASPMQGNQWGSATGPFVYPFGTADMNFLAGSTADWRVSLTTTQGGVGTIRVYVNGVLKRSDDRPYNAGPFMLFDGVPVVSGDRVYIEFEHIRYV
ncbi:DUF5977 domain-containing protein [Fibrella aquatilis]|uniref:DUF5977 domain-containing protein n=1 Tax=Fibrella aquatilis TaxID=2817059 RepID=A0A939G828_9BACT|nr:DUF5977 domain-containing protein [Fibrella aquatilis]MBO0933934.1 hypothetical protein [Fibrella aquatilis]